MNLIVWLVPIFLWAEDKVPVEFEMKKETCLSQEILWDQFEQSMADSRTTWIWPQSRSSVVGEGLSEEAFIEVTYRSTFSSPTYTYQLKNVISGNSFRYQAVEGKHPFEGGANIKIEPKENGSELSWVGLYLTEPGQWLQRRFFKNYEKAFFEDLLRNIEDAEGEFCQ